MKRNRKNLEKTAEVIVPYPFEDVDIFTRGGGYNDFFYFKKAHAHETDTRNGKKQGINELYLVENSRHAIL